MTRAFSYLRSVLFIAAVVYAVCATQDWGRFAQPRTSVNVYFATPDGYLVRARVAVPPAQVNPIGALEALLAGPKPRQDLAAPVPTTTRLLGFTVTHGTADVVLSSAFTRDASGGTTGDELRVMSVVDTLTEWPAIARVSLRVPGESAASLSTHLDLEQPITRDLTFVKTQP